MLPVETILAVFPTAVAVGKLTLRPLTLMHIAAMEALGIETEESVGDSQVLMAAWIMSMSPEDVRNLVVGGRGVDGFERWIDEVGPTLEDALQAVRMNFSQAYLPFVPGENSSRGHTMKSGYGWPLELAEAYTAEYGCTFDEAMSVPICRMLGMMAAARVRNGGKAGGPDYYERMFIGDMKKHKGEGMK